MLTLSFLVKSCSDSLLTLIQPVQNRKKNNPVRLHGHSQCIKAETPAFSHNATLNVKNELFYTLFT
jgi:hypothetical protein